MRVKICGLTRPEDALAAEAAGADAVAVNFAPASKRRVSLEQAREVIAPLGPLIARIGVFVDAPLAEVLDTARRLRLSAVQLHGSEDADYALRVASEFPLIRAVRFAPGLEPTVFADYPAAALLLDGLEPGSGEVFPWAEAAAWIGCPKLILAGGLTPETVASSIRALRPYAVDVASGVEARPGVKDRAKIEAFVRAARSVSTL